MPGSSRDCSDGARMTMRSARRSRGEREDVERRGRARSSTEGDEVKRKTVRARRMLWCVCGYCCCCCCCCADWLGYGRAPSLGRHFPFALEISAPKVSWLAGWLAGFRLLRPALSPLSRASHHSPLEPDPKAFRLPCSPSAVARSVLFCRVKPRDLARVSPEEPA
jgi:hypothetical protein